MVNVIFKDKNRKEEGQKEQRTDPTLGRRASKYARECISKFINNDDGR